MPSTIPLPTKRIAALLDEQGIEVTWKQLLLTFALKSFSNKTYEMLSDSLEFQSVQTLDDNPLEGLSLGRIGLMYEFSLAHVNHESRKESGQYFTPDDVAILMASLSENFSEGKWLDPCSGIGNLSYWLANRQENPEEFIIHNLILADRDALALLIARTLFSLFYQNKYEDLFTILKPNFIHKDFFELESEYDYVIFNPPYAATALDNRFETAKARDLYAYFMEKVIKTSKGFIAVTPQSFTNGGKFQTLRDMLINKFSTVKIYCFDNIPDSIFKGIKFGSQNTNMANSTRAAITLAQQTNEGHFITPLLRWTSDKREQMFANIDTFLGVIQKSTLNLFPKNWKHLNSFYKQYALQNTASLKTLLSVEPTEYKLTVPTTPRYFISATKRKLERTSFKVLYFKDLESMNKAYLLMNSSFLYWWWKLNDGGMTLSSETLLSLPIPSIHMDQFLVTALEESEIVNLVGKLNAGKINENVKHPRELVNRINYSLFGKENAEHLTHIHSNSDI